MTEHIDVVNGGDIAFDDGRVVTLKPHSCRVWVEVWNNGTIIETLCYPERQPDSVDSDRIHLLITPESGEEIGWLMNIEDATAIIAGLSRAIGKAIDMGVPVHG